MANSMKDARQRGRYCVAGAPSLISKALRIYRPPPGIECFSSRTIPTVRGKWVKFVRRQRHDLNDPTWP